MSSVDIVQLFCVVCAVFAAKTPQSLCGSGPQSFFFCFRFKISVNLWNKLADENPFSPTSCKIICGCSETLITKKLFSGRAEEWGHVLMNQTTLLSWLAHSGFCCLSKFSTQSVTVRQKEEERWSKNSGRWFAVLTRLPAVYVWKEETIKRDPTWYILN